MALGQITKQEISPDFLNELLSGGGDLRYEVKSVVATTDRQKEFKIPMDTFDKTKHFFDLRLGSVGYHPSRYTVVGNSILLNKNEAGIALGRRLDFYFCYLVKEPTADEIPETDLTFALPTITHNLNKYPIVQVYEYEYGFGAGRAGYGMAGGSLAINPSFKINLIDRNSINILLHSKHEVPQNLITITKVSDEEYVVSLDKKENCFIILIR